MDAESKCPVMHGANTKNKGDGRVKYAFYPGCVARGGTPELLSSSMAVLKELNIEIEELTKAGCTGAGVLQEKNPLLGDTINVRTLAMAEEKSLDIMTLCSTCQGVLSQANHKVKNDPEYLAKINALIEDEGYKYKGTTEVKHLLWILVEDYGLDNLKSHFVKELSNLKFAPFYGCYINLLVVSLLHQAIVLKLQNISLQKICLNLH